MLKILSGFRENQLGYFLKRIREIAILGDEAALIETDKFIWEVLRGDGPEDEGVKRAREEAAKAHWEAVRIRKEAKVVEVREFLQAFQKKISRKTVSFYDIQEFRVLLQRTMSHSFDAWSEGVEIAQFKAEGLALADQAAPVAFDSGIEQCHIWTFRNITSVLSMLNALEAQVTQFLVKNELTPDMVAKIREIKERGARYRWNKKRSDADVAEEAGFGGKAAALRREADAVLVQDWEMVFPDEVPPP